MSETSGGVAVQQARSELSTVLEELLRISKQHQIELSKLLWGIDNRLKTAEEEFEKLDRFIGREQAFQQCESTGEWIYASPGEHAKVCRTCGGTGEFRFSEDELSTVHCRECNGEGVKCDNRN